VWWAGGPRFRNFHHQWDSNNIIVIIGIFTRYPEFVPSFEQTAVYCGDCKFHKRSDETLLTPPRQCFGINYIRHGRLTINAHHLTTVHVLITFFTILIRTILSKRFLTQDQNLLQDTLIKHNNIK